MGAYLDLSAMNAALKELYDGQVVENLVYADNPWLAMVKKNTDFGGKYKPIPIINGVSQGTSSTFANAQGNQSPVQIQSFLLTRTSQYSIATIDNQTMLASKTDKMSFLEGSKLVIDGAIRSATNAVASAIFRSGTGSLAQNGGITAGVITLSNSGDVVQFELNMVLQAAATDGGTPRAALGYVVAVNRAGGTITVSATGIGGVAGTPSGWTTNDYLLMQGDSNLKASGLAAWLPPAAPGSADSFYGVNRSVDTWRLGGGRYGYNSAGVNTASQSIEESLIDASSLGAREGAKMKTGITNFQSWGALEKSLGSKCVYIDHKGPAEIAFRGIRLHGANTTIDVFPDRNCQVQTCYLLQMDTWALEGLGDVPQILRYGDGLEMLRVYNSDAGEVRVGAYYNVRTNAPGWNMNVALSA